MTEEAFSRIEWEKQSTTHSDKIYCLHIIYHSINTIPRLYKELTTNSCLTIVRYRITAKGKQLTEKELMMNDIKVN